MQVKKKAQGVRQCATCGYFPLFPRRGHAALYWEGSKDPTHICSYFTKVFLILIFPIVSLGLSS